jgi:hypothetical protein
MGLGYSPRSFYQDNSQHISAMCQSRNPVLDIVRDDIVNLPRCLIGLSYIRRFVNDLLFPSWCFLLMAIDNSEDLLQRQYQNLYYSAIFLIKIFRIFCSSHPRHMISISEYSNCLGLGSFGRHGLERIFPSRPWHILASESWVDSGNSIFGPRPL